VVTTARVPLLYETQVPYPTVDQELPPLLHSRLVVTSRRERPQAASRIRRKEEEKGDREVGGIVEVIHQLGSRLEGEDLVLRMEELQERPDRLLRLQHRSLPMHKGIHISKSFICSATAVHVTVRTVQSVVSRTVREERRNVQRYQEWMYNMRMPNLMAVSAASISAVGLKHAYHSTKSFALLNQYAGCCCLTVSSTFHYYISASPLFLAVHSEHKLSVS
jgi:hypothetical protein